MTELHASTVNLREVFDKLRAAHPKSGYRIALVLSTDEEVIIDEVIDDWQDAMLVTTERIGSRAGQPLLVKKSFIVMVRITPHRARADANDD